MTPTAAPTRPPTRPGTGADLDRLAVTTLRFLALDMIEAAGSGHPGMALGAAPALWALVSRHLRHDPADPAWEDRDRFVLSAGHASALHYAALHLAGYDLSTEDLRAFRRLGSRTPGHPEAGHTPGVEVTTGPLGQGLATAVGLALAERVLAARDPALVDHRTWVLAGDGCLAEGISHEAASLAGHLGLGRLGVVWDDNRVTIDGPVASASSEDQVARFAAYGWHVVTVPDGEDVDAVDAALQEAVADPRPSLVAVRTVIGRGAPEVAGTSRAHGSPLGSRAVAAMKAAAGWAHPPFTVPSEVSDHARLLAARGAAARAAWQERRDALAAAEPARARERDRGTARALPEDWAPLLEDIGRDLASGRATPRATRQWSQDVLTRLAARLPELVGGSADLAGSTGVLTGQRLLTREDATGHRIAFGVREHAMGAVLNGLALHGLRAYGSTFLVFSDYLRPALRLSALMGLPVVLVLSHDSVAVGEDGPTHQPVEHLESLRSVPGLRVLRPADDVETLAAWRQALERTDGPTALVLSRQALPALDDVAEPPVPGVRVVRQPRRGEPAVDLLATGSEVALALAAADLLAAEGLEARVLSVLDRDAVEGLPRERRRVSVEAGVSSGWRGLVDLAVGIDDFGVSGRGEDVLRHLGLSPEALARRVRELCREETGGATCPRS